MNKDKNDTDWTFQRQSIRNETMRVLAMSQEPSKLHFSNLIFLDVDKFSLVAKLMNMRDALQKQVFHSCLYRKLVIWNDLNIQCGEWCHQKVVECMS